MANERKFCAGCLRDDEENEAISWCSDCGELVCKHCGRAHTRFVTPHKIVPLEQANTLSSNVLNLSKTCEKHVKQKLLLFCCQHDKIICASCVPEKHQNCKSVISIDDAAKGVRSGAAVDDLERRLANLYDVLDKLANENCDKDVDKQAQDIQKQISELRKKVDSHFDKIENDIKRETERKRTECKQTTSHMKNELKIKVDNIKQWQRDIVSLKASGSEMHLFQAVKYLDIQTHKSEAEVRNNQVGRTHSLKFFPSANARNIESMLIAFGTVKIIKNHEESDQLALLKQGQQYMGGEKSKTIVKTSSFTSSDLEEKAQVMSASFASGNKLLLCNLTGKCLYICNRDGSCPEKKSFEYELTKVTMYDANRALISMRQKGVFLFDVSSRTCEQISTSGWWDISSAGDTIIVRDGSKHLSQIGIDGKLIKKIATDFYVENICVGHRGANVYYSDGKNAVHMVTSDGRQSKFYESADLVEAHGLVSDEIGNIYVLGRGSSNIHKISSDGKTAKVILTASDGLDLPRYLAYNITTKELLVVNSQSSVLIYKVA